MRTIFIIYSTVLSTMCWGQYEYFQHVFGIQGDDESEVFTNIEISGQEYLIWGQAGFDGQDHKVLTKLNEQGDYIDENTLLFENELLYVGTTNSLLHKDEHLYVARGIDNGDTIDGILIKATLDLDTIWTKRFDFFDPMTNFFALNHDGDDIIICGEYGAAPGEKGTFLAKVDTDGNLLWHDTLHVPTEGVYRALKVSRLDNGYLVTGVEGTTINSSGYTEYTDLEGNLLWSLDVPNPEILGPGTTHFLDESDSPIITQLIVYEDWPFSPNEILGYGKIRYLTVDFGTPALINEGEVLVNNEVVLPAPSKSLIASDGGYITCGQMLKPVGSDLYEQSYILKVNQDFELEWYTELAYDPCATCVNTIYDMVRAPDGGYTLAGEFRDNAIDPFPRSWLVKVDACGDLEWQGCETVGLSEFETLELKLEVYPNPAQDIISIEVDENFDPTSVQLINMLGDVVLEKEYDEVIGLSMLETGLYVLQVVNTQGQILTKKMMVE